MQYHSLTESELAQSPATYMARFDERREQGESLPYTDDLSEFSARVAARVAREFLRETGKLVAEDSREEMANAARYAVALLFYGENAEATYSQAIAEEEKTFRRLFELRARSAARFRRAERALFRLRRVKEDPAYLCYLVAFRAARRELYRQAQAELRPHEDLDELSQSIATKRGCDHAPSESDAMPILRTYVAICRAKRKELRGKPRAAYRFEVFVKPLRCQVRQMLGLAYREADTPDAKNPDAKRKALQELRQSLAPILAQLSLA